MFSSSRSFLFYTLALICVCELLVLVANPPPIQEQMKEIYPQRDGLKVDHPLIVLYQGSIPRDDRSYSSGYWPGWGTKERNLKEKSVDVLLPWAAEGLWITKSCEVSCYVTHSQSLLPIADGVIMELINHPRTFGSAPIHWPKKKMGQEWGLFYYEPFSSHSSFLTEDVMNHFDFTMTPSQDSDLPVTLICTWGKKKSDYLAPIPPKNPKATICDFSGSNPNEFTHFLGELRNYISIDSFSGPWKNSEPESPYRLPNRMRFISQYKFIIITEVMIENDWISPDLSQAWLSGTLPIYLGAPNIDEFVPGPKSLIKITDFESAEDLANHITYLLENEDAYKEYFAWKEKGLSPAFKTHLDNCAHFAECRVCKHVLQQQNKK